MVTHMRCQIVDTMIDVQNIHSLAIITDEQVWIAEFQVIKLLGEL